MIYGENWKALFKPPFSLLIAENTPTNNIQPFRSRPDLLFKNRYSRFVSVKKLLIYGVLFCFLCRTPINLIFLMGLHQLSMVDFAMFAMNCLGSDNPLINGNVRCNLGGNWYQDWWFDYVIRQILIRSPISRSCIKEKWNWSKQKNVLQKMEYFRNESHSKIKANMSVGVHLDYIFH